MLRGNFISKIKYKDRNTFFRLQLATRTSLWSAQIFTRGPFCAPQRYTRVLLHFISQWKRKQNVLKSLNTTPPSRRVVKIVVIMNNISEVNWQGIAGVKTSLFIKRCTTTFPSIYLIIWSLSTIGSHITTLIALPNHILYERFICFRSFRILNP